PNHGLPEDAVVQVEAYLVPYPNHRVPLVSVAPRKLELPQGHSNAPSENIFHGVADVEVPETSTGQMGPGTNNWDAYQAIGVACAHNRKGDGTQATTGQGLDALGDPRPDGILPIAIAEKQDGPCMGYNGPIK